MRLFLFPGPRAESDKVDTGIVDLGCHMENNQGDDQKRLRTELREAPSLKGHVEGVAREIHPEGRYENPKQVVLLKVEDGRCKKK